MGKHTKTKKLKKNKKNKKEMWRHSMICSNFKATEGKARNETQVSQILTLCSLHMPTCFYSTAKQLL